jgi:hypothetical protein
MRWVRSDIPLMVSSDAGGGVRQLAGGDAR